MDDHLKQLYQTDPYLWLYQQAELLLAHDFERLDLPNLIEELEAMGKNKRRQLEHRLEVLLTHLLKFHIQRDHISSSWVYTIAEQRKSILQLLKKMPSLRADLDEAVARTYRDAVFFAAQQTSLPKSAFPVALPFSTKQVLDKDYFP